ncbi:unnamed protein product [Didymodactylos carnosus]|uniref:Uncharacterized protein n=1 Tax=Didymodactylos carnosus TaxID=1234261 RepID=A0A816B9D2_9BILA|nr:unnamed protein product [Didymodactylos carnosus]CAF4488216.1 unnamed protein product [Didymodactylos carnosus]
MNIRHKTGDQDSNSLINNKSHNYGSIKDREQQKLSPLYRILKPLISYCSQFSSNKYTKFDNNEKKQINKRETISVYNLFRYADHLDRILLISAVGASIMHGICYAAYYLLFGQIVSTFASYVNPTSSDLNNEELRGTQKIESRRMNGFRYPT